MSGGDASGTGSDDLRKLGLDTMSSVVAANLPPDADLRDGQLGEDLVEIGLIGVWAALWAREGLARRDRSLVTLGILIALGAEDEVKSHVRIGLNNGLTENEIAEVLYHAAGYAGFPRAMAARKAARAAMSDGPLSAEES
ncbi:carboxymuconolactone decarboxylase [Amycolatopsis mediterranei S699]|uniref:Carboxymuconolactone decarboxylase n=2 Tax=Amycolatopsis mediterranei TaxID=33910 RepID=A0A0H3DF74_AMYMU|nr:carboxymuconolactone decarboxylase family protein [Amycolatopsis mediterranei]ADJ48862.1 carboxymuconolactone decarboxylase [Amycolatopsis mediterranei U32]AEK45810.1 carboxymuconolactone decarboxylase [Amycolatopsis mediterranei S699]AFO80570.1 carboxymuconolactone decarboxylase [Amycolatopsis mediterranei S699]AGT87698.1 carboxymuconolactone decarboxylase [Amycolatopsis mediterranei RB]KDU94023.1 carboxymuconolactone decarboxylase [Amycolatopsis mediterranei]